MVVLDALNTRFTVRAFRPDPIDRETLERVMEAALRSPSWANTQPWEVYVAGGEVLNRLREAYLTNLKNCVARNPDLAVPKEWPPALKKRMEDLKSERLATLERVCLDKSELKDLAEMNYHFFHAPVVAYICMDKTLTPWSIYDLGLFSQSLMLAARHFGLDSAPAVTLAAHPDLVRKELQIPDGLSIIIGIALGYADIEHPQNQYRTTRRTVQEAVTFKGI
ncbi:MAG TPA: nitroreductase [Nitrospirota bacterium]|nr:nitroreductase [Nitrospirota bacterium]